MKQYLGATQTKTQQDMAIVRHAVNFIRRDPDAPANDDVVAVAMLADVLGYSTLAIRHAIRTAGFLYGIELVKYGPDTNTTWMARLITRLGV